MVISVILGFVTRKVFVDNIGIDYLGLNGLLLNILGFATLLEGGFGASITYNLYKPLAEKNKERIIALVQFFQKVYRYIALGVFSICFCLFFFLNYLIEDLNSLNYVGIVYFIFLFNTLIQYFTAYKWAVINADQKNYKLAVYNLIYQVGLSATKLAILYYTQNYILYLLIESAFALWLNVAVVRKVNKLYPYLVTKTKYPLDDKTKENLKTNVKALALHGLGGFMVHSTDNIVISSYISIAAVGLYSNYTLIINTIDTACKQIINGFSESIANLIVSESKEKVYSIFQIFFLLNFIIFSIPSIICYHLLNPFINWWLGEEYVLSQYLVIIIIIKFYIFGMRLSSLIFKTKAGIFTQDRYSPLMQGIINLILSLIFVRYWGVTGVLAATILSVLAIGFWQFPRLVYKHVFKLPLYLYFKKYLQYTILAGIALYSSTIVSQQIQIGNDLMQLFALCITTLLCCCIIYLLALWKDPAFARLYEYTLKLIKKK